MSPEIPASLRKRCLVALLSALLASGAAAQADKGSQFYEDALLRFERKEYAGAIIQLKNALRANPRQLAVQVLLGKALLEDGQPLPAEVAFREALRLGVNRAEVVQPLARATLAISRADKVIDDPVFSPAGLEPAVLSEVLLLRAEAHSDLGNTGEALKAMDAARAVGLESTRGLMAEVPVRIRARQFAQAKAAAEKAVAQSGGAVQALYLLGSALHAGGDLKSAVDVYGRAIAKDPRHLESLLARAGLMIDMGKLPEAKTDVTVAREVAPKDPRAAYLGALLAEKSGDSKGAKAALADVTSLLDPVPIEAMRFRPQLLMLGGLSHYGLGQSEKALPYLQAAQRAQPTSPSAKLLAQLLIGNGSIDGAVEVLDAYSRAHPGDWQAQMLLANAHQQGRRLARAVQVLESALKHADVPALRAALGQALVTAGRPNQAIPNLENALRRQPDLQAAAALLVDLYLRARQPRKALTVVEGLLRKQPQSAAYLTLLGSAHAQAGDGARARAAFEQALKADPAHSPAELRLHRLDVAAGDLVAADRRLQRILSREPKHVDALIDAALLAERAGRPAATARLLETALLHSEATDTRAGTLLITHHLQGQRVAAAQAVVGQLVQRSPDSLVVLMAGARVQLAAGKSEEARALLTRASRSAEFDPELQTQVATMQLQALDAKGAQYSLTKALQARPSHLAAEALLVEAELYLGEAAQADARARKLAQRHPRLAVGHSLVGQVAMVGGHEAAALDAYRKAHQVEPSEATVIRLHRALSPRDPAEAVRVLAQWLTSRPDDLAVRKELGDAHARAGAWPQARLAYDAVIKKAPEDADVLNNLAHVLIALKDPSALQVAERAMALRPQSAHVAGTAGWAAYHAGQSERALQLLRDSRLRDPGNGEVRYFLATVLAQQGRKAEAREELRAGLAAGASLLSAGKAKELLATLN